MIDPEVQKLVDTGVSLRTAYRLVRKEHPKKREPKYEYSKGRWV